MKPARRSFRLHDVDDPNDVTIKILNRVKRSIPKSWEQKAKRSADVETNEISAPSSMVSHDVGTGADFNEISLAPNIGMHGKLPPGAKPMYHTPLAKPFWQPSLKWWQNSDDEDKIEGIINLFLPNELTTTDSTLNSKLSTQTGSTISDEHSAKQISTSDQDEYSDGSLSTTVEITTTDHENTMRSTTEIYSSSTVQVRTGSTAAVHLSNDIQSGEVNNDGGVCECYCPCLDKMMKSAEETNNLNSLVIPKQLPPSMTGSSTEQGDKMDNDTDYSSTPKIEYITESETMESSDGSSVFWITEENYDHPYTDSSIADVILNSSQGSSTHGDQEPTTIKSNEDDYNHPYTGSSTTEAILNASHSSSAYGDQEQTTMKSSEYDYPQERTTLSSWSSQWDGWTRQDENYDYYYDDELLEDPLNFHTKLTDAYEENNDINIFPGTRQKLPLASSTNYKDSCKCIEQGMDREGNKRQSF